jgi:nitroreductase
MLLAASCLGLGSVVFTDIFPDRVKRILNIPDPLKVICLLPIGFPAESPEMRFRREVGEFTHDESYEHPKLRPDSFVSDARKDPSKLFLKKA